MSHNRHDTKTVPAPQTYAESRGEPPFDWNLFLERAIRGEISDAEHLRAADLSREWVTCAVGSQCSVIPRMKCGLPTDFILQDEGRRFFELILWGYFTAAKATLARIEARSAELIAKLPLGHVTSWQASSAQPYPPVRP